MSRVCCSGWWGDALFTMSRVCHFTFSLKFVFLDRLPIQLPFRSLPNHPFPRPIPARSSLLTLRSRVEFSRPSLPLFRELFKTLSQRVKTSHASYPQLIRASSLRPPPLSLSRRAAIGCRPLKDAYRAFSWVANHPTRGKPRSIFRIILFHHSSPCPCHAHACYLAGWATCQRITTLQPITAAARPPQNTSLRSLICIALYLPQQDA